MTFVHQCGAKVTVRNGRQWTARQVDGTLQCGFADFVLAAEWIENNDPLFWSVGKWAFGGKLVKGISVEAFYLDEQRINFSTMYSLDSASEMPAYLRSPLKCHLLSKATCMKCGSHNSEIHLRQINVHHGMMFGRRAYFLVCQCDHPVWRMAMDDEFATEKALYRAAAALLREDNLKRAGGRHTPDELREILALQGNRCIYCHASFTDSLPFTKDHLLPVTCGGTDWALNIVMACRSCNTRRGEIPFRTYCKLLSPTQNRRIIRHLAKRFQAIDMERLPKAAFASLLAGLTLHQPCRSRFRSIICSSPVRRHYASVNRALPSSPYLIVKRASSLK